ncbi:hypothetical protein D9613_005483 [Agrocybe pediades]|uniref:Uncharacterized protein n=1 Tax=Agrocybe pediades TaxID=84607 RepID=A0A8H4QYT8_9AGAR|nr:hypothetical protein D9613_005483 [Agrocybe pediades]
MNLNFSGGNDTSSSIPTTENAPTNSQCRANLAPRAYSLDLRDIGDSKKAQKTTWRSSPFPSTTLPVGSGSTSTSTRFSPSSRSTSQTANNVVSHPAVLPPRYRRPRKQWVVDSKNIQVKGRAVLLFDLPDVSSKLEARVHGLLSDLGFSNQTSVVGCGDHTISVEFSHSHIASAAYAILLVRGQTLWHNLDGDTDDNAVEMLVDDQEPQLAETVQRNEKVPFAVGTEVPSSVEEDEDLYRNLAKDIYDDDTEYSSASEMSSSPSTKIKPLQPAVPDHLSELLSPNRDFDVHLSKTFDLPPYIGTLPNSPPKNDIERVKPRTTASRTHKAPSTRKSPETESHVIHVPIPKSPYNRARRIVLPNDPNRPFVTVSMRSDIQFYQRQKPHHRLTKYSYPNYSGYRHTVDAIPLGEAVVIACDRGPCQVSLLRFNSEDHSPCLMDLQLKPHKVSLDAQNSNTTGAITCLAAKSLTNGHLKFFTGGYDRSLYIWNAKTLDSITTERLTTITTIPEALAFRHGTLLIGTSRKLLQLDLEHLTSTPIVTQLSNSVHQIHVDKQAPNIALLEVNSLDFQVQMFDERIKHSFDRTADCYFGARQTSSPAQANRGDVKSFMFVKGYQDGVVRMWDFRNVKVYIVQVMTKLYHSILTIIVSSCADFQQPVLKHQFEDMGPIVHAVFAGGGIVCYQDNSLSFIDLAEKAP